MADGGSALEQLIATKGEIPYPFSKFVDSTTIEIVSVIPDGRSLQRKKATYREPRIIRVVGDFRKPESRIFLGFAPNAEQVEAISWNPGLRRYEFQIIRNYGPGKKPEVITPPRETCIACHQAGAPIFSRFPWGETTGRAALSIPRDPHENVLGLYKKVIAARKGEQVYQGFDMRFEKLSAGSGATPANIDFAVREANLFQQAQNACVNMCGNDLECRAALVESALYCGDFDAEDPRTQRRPITCRGRHPRYSDFLQRLQTLLEKNWPADGFAYPSSVLLSRDPLIGKAGRVRVLDSAGAEAIRHVRGFHGLGEAGDPLTEQDIKDRIALFPHTLGRSSSNKAVRFEEEIKSGLDLNYSENASEGLYNDGHEVILSEIDGSIADPKKPRPLVNKIPKEWAAQAAIGISFQCIGFKPEDLKLFKGFTPEQLQDAFKRIEFKKALTQWPPQRETIITALLAALGAKDIPDCFKDQTSAPLNMSVTSSQAQKIADAAAQKKIFPNTKEGQTLALFDNYCARCHSGKNAFYELPLGQLQALKKYRGEVGGRTVSEMLEKKRMPPAAFPQPSDHERVQMLEGMR